MSYKPIDGAKEDFRKYLDRKGVMDALTKAFVLCYDERPENPIERLVEVIADNAKILGASSELKSRLINTELELKQARQEIDLLRKQLTDLGATPVSMPSLGGGNANSATASQQVTGNGPAIATLSAEAEKTVPSSNTSAVEAAAAVNTGAIPKTPKVTTAATQATPAQTEHTPSESATTTTDSTATTTTTSNPSNTTGANTEEASGTTTTTQVVTAATNTEESTVKEEAT